MRLAWAWMFVLFAVGGCGNTPSTTPTDGGTGPTTCGLRTDLTFEAGFIRATLDGNSFRAAGVMDVAGGVSGGSLIINLTKDDQGGDVLSQITAGTFPICVNIGQNSPTASFAQYFPAGGTYSTDANNTGRLAVLGIENNQVKGVFQLTAGRVGGGTPVVFTEGTFLVDRQ